MIATSDPAVAFERVSFSYAGSPVLEEVSVAVPRGRISSIVGPNGGGKTTFLRLCLGLLQPDTGTLQVLGTSPERARSRIGYVPQHFSFDVHFPVTVTEVVLLGRLGRHRRFGFFGAQDRQQAATALAEVDLAALGQRPLASLSGGERQRVLIARALVTEPELLLLDEPTANVDQKTQHELYALMHRLSERLTVVLVTHDMNLVSDRVDRVICINRRAHVHPTAEIPPGAHLEFQGENLRLVRHDRHLHDERGA